MNNNIQPPTDPTEDRDAVTVAEAARTTIIRCLNDAFRTTFAGGRIMLTRGILALGGEAQRQILEKVRAFDAFCAGNDPHGEHDFGAFEHAGETIAFKIDTYDPSLTYAYENPADASVTVRVMTVMLLDEW